MASTVDAWRSLDQQLIDDPSPLFDSWRDAGPVVAVPELGGWAVTGYAEAVSVLRDPSTWSSTHAVEGPPDRRRERWARDLADEDASFAALVDATPQALIAVDQPAHTRLRKALVPLFSAAAIKRLEPLVASLVNELAPEVLCDDEVDFVERFALRLPLDTVCALFGIPASDRLRFKEIAVAADLDNPHLETKEDMRSRFRAELQLRDFFARGISGATLGDDGVLAGLRAAVEEGRLDLAEACGLCRELLVAGSDSTVNHLASAVLLLSQDPALLERVRDDLDQRSAFIEEALRLEPPFHGFWRRATRDVRLGGVDLPAGAFVLLSFPVLNRDAGLFERAAEVDLTRANPKRHLTFGQGVHFCVGAPLARLESAATFAALLPRTSRIELLVEPSELRWKPSVQIRGLERLPVRFHLRED